MDKPGEPTECEDCGGESYWEEIVWEFAEKVDEESDTVSLPKARTGYVRVCSKCALIQELSLGEVNWEPDFSAPKEDARTVGKVTMTLPEEEVEVSVAIDIDEETISNEGDVFTGELFVAEEEAASLEGERVWLDLDEGVVRRGDEDGEVIGTDVWSGVEE